MNTQDIKDSKNLNAPSKGNVPALRFPEFTEEWTAETIDELFELRNGYTPSKNNLDFWNNGTIPWFRMEDIRLNGGVLKDAIQHITPEAVKGSGLFEPYSIILATTATIGEHAMLIADSLANQRFTNFKIRKSLTYKYNPYYLYYYFFKIDKWCLKNTNAGGLLSVDIPSLKRQKLYSPSVEEQNKIAKLLRLIDDRISIQSRIIEDLKKLKSAIVETILCKQGGVLLKLGDVGSFIRGLTYSSEDISEDINATTVIRANNLNYGNNVSKEDVVYVNKKPTEIQILRKGDIVICMANGSSSLVGKNSYYPFGDRQSTIGAFCGIYRSPQPLVKWLMQSQRYRRLVYQSIQGGNGAIANLNGDDILNMTFRVVEDKKSVSILSALVMIENSIAVNEKLQELCSMQKEYLLQHLFI